MFRSHLVHSSLILAPISTILCVPNIPRFDQVVRFQNDLFLYIFYIAILASEFSLTLGEAGSLQFIVISRQCQ